MVAPSGPVPREAFEAGARILGARHRLVYDERIFARQGYMAGDDAARLTELERALGDPAVKAVVCARGGYGLLRLLDRIDVSALARYPKLIVGFSDITVLHAIAGRAGVASLHGPVVTQLGELPVSDVEALCNALESPEPPPPLAGLRCLQPGAAEGVLAGGNLEVLSRLVGTEYTPVPWLAGSVLVLEEVGERPYRIDRALTQLALGGALGGVRGAIVGDLVRCAEADGSGPSAEQVFAERLGRFGIPMVAGAPVGHGGRNRALPLGARVRLDAGAGTVEFLDAAVS